MNKKSFFLTYMISILLISPSQLFCSKEDHLHQSSPNASTWLKNTTLEIGTKVIVLSSAMVIAACFLKKLTNNWATLPIAPQKSSINLKMIIGLDDEKKELRDTVAYLKNPSYYERNSIRVPHAIILAGDPGNGKKLLARAVAGETGYNFLSVSANNFLDMADSIGAARVHTLFKEADKNMPCIIFIEDLDIIAAQPVIPGFGNRHEQTLFALLSEIDALYADIQANKRKNVFVIATTTRPFSLDSSLFNRGRFENIIRVAYPSAQDRFNLLAAYSAHLKKDKTIDLEEIAKTIPTFSRTDCMHLINTAALIASHEATPIISSENIKEAIEKIVITKNSIRTTSENNTEQTKTNPRLIIPANIKEDFSMVAGIPQVKEELQTIVRYLENPEHYESLGARVPRGILLEGKPGTGKTFIARALAKEANCAFFAVNGSDFVEKYVGVGAQRVRDLFADARKSAPSIIFIDEIDAVGRKRSSETEGSHQEREQTLNQLLVEMDGFNQFHNEPPIIVIGATNRVDVLDNALLRAGRFDQKIYVPYPSMEGRREILAVHCTGLPLDPTVSLDSIARGTVDFSGAALANLANQAALAAANDNRKTVTNNDFEKARDTILLGKENKHIVRTKEELRQTAYHEAGHALVSLLMPTNTILHKLTIASRGPALGVTHFLPEKDTYDNHKENILAYIVCFLGGRAAEEIVFNKLSTGAHNDFEKARHSAEEMVRSYGMSEKLGCMIYPSDSQYSQITQHKIDEEIHAIIQECYEKAKKLLRDNRDKLNLLAETLLEKETLFSAEVYELLNMPPRADLRLNQNPTA